MLLMHIYDAFINNAQVTGIAFNFYNEVIKITSILPNYDWRLLSTSICELYPDVPTTLTRPWTSRACQPRGHVRAVWQPEREIVLSPLPKCFMVGDLPPRFTLSVRRARVDPQRKHRKGNSASRHSNSKPPICKLPSPPFFGPGSNSYWVSVVVVGLGGRPARETLTRSCTHMRLRVNVSVWVQRDATYLATLKHFRRLRVQLEAHPQPAEPHKPPLHASDRVMRVGMIPHLILKQQDSEMYCRLPDAQPNAAYLWCYTCDLHLYPSWCDASKHQPSWFWGSQLWVLTCQRLETTRDFLHCCHTSYFHWKGDIQRLFWGFTAQFLFVN